MQSRSGQPWPEHCRMRPIDRDLIRGGHYGQRSREPLRRPNTWLAPTNAARVKKALANWSRPHGPSGSGPGGRVCCLSRRHRFFDDLTAHFGNRGGSGGHLWAGMRKSPCWSGAAEADEVRKPVLVATLLSHRHYRPSSKFLTIAYNAASPSVRAAGPGCKITNDLIS